MFIESYACVIRESVRIPLNSKNPVSVYNDPGLKVITLFFTLNSTEHQIYHAYKC